MSGFKSTPDHVARCIFVNPDDSFNRTGAMRCVTQISGILVLSLGLGMPASSNQAFQGGGESHLARVIELRREAGALMIQSEFSKAKVTYVEAIDEARKCGNREELAKTLLSYGVACRLDLDISNALHATNEGLGLARTISPNLAGQALVNLALVHSAAGRAGRSRAFNVSACTLLSQGMKLLGTNIGPVAKEALMEILITYAEREAKEDQILHALTLANRVRAAIPPVGSQQKFSALLRLAAVYGDCSELDREIELLVEAYDVQVQSTQEKVYNESLAAVSYNLAVKFVQFEQYDRANVLYTYARDAYKALGIQDGVVQTNIELVNVMRMQNHRADMLEPARANLRDARTLSQSEILLEALLSLAYVARINLEWQEAKNAADEGLRLSVAEHWQLRAGFNDLLAQIEEDRAHLKAAVGYLRKEVDILEEEAAKIPPLPKSHWGFWTVGRRTPFQHLGELLNRLQRTGEAVACLESGKGRSFLAPDRSTLEPNTALIRLCREHPNRIYLSYYLLGKITNLVCVASARHGIRLYTLHAGADRIESLVNEWRTSILAVDLAASGGAVTERERQLLAGAEVQKGRALCDALLPVDVRKDIRTFSEVMISPDGSVWKAPMAALVLQDGSRLVDHACVSFCWALRSSATQQSVIRSWQVLDLIGPAFNKGLLGVNSKTLTSARTIPENLIQAASDTAFYVRGHYEANVVNPFHSLLLDRRGSDLGSISSADLSELKSQCPAVLIGACEPLGRHGVSQESPMGLVWALRATGIPRIIFPHWAISASEADETFGVLARTTHRDIAATLHQMQLKLRRAGRPVRTWSAFTVIEG